MIPNTLKRALKQGIVRLSRRKTPQLSGHPDVPSVVIAYNEHGAYCVPRSSLHRPACQATLRGRVWERETLAFMCINCALGDIVHAGTYFGDFLPALSKALAPGRKVWAFEAAAENYRCAKSTVALNDLDNIELRHAALGPKTGELGFVTVDERGQPLGGGSHYGLSGGNETVTQIRLDDAIPDGRTISILHLDVEGYEEEVLAGAQEIIRRNRPIVILETAPPRFADTHDYLLQERLNGNSVFRACDPRPHR